MTLTDRNYFGKRILKHSQIEIPCLLPYLGPGLMVMSSRGAVTLHIVLFLAKSLFSVTFHPHFPFKFPPPLIPDTLLMVNISQLLHLDSSLYAKLSTDLPILATAFIFYTVFYISPLPVTALHSCPANR